MKNEPAFPAPTEVTQCSKCGEFTLLDSGSCGMSLRDWFAGQALAGLIGLDALLAAKRIREILSGAPAELRDETMSTERVSQDAYRFADAMLREKNHG